MTALAAWSQADALQTTKAFKEEVLTIVITPSPSPLAMHWPVRRPNADGVAVAAAPKPVAPNVARLVADPYAGPAMVASSGSAWDVAPGGPRMIAQVVPAQPTPVPVRFNAKPDPNAMYLRIIPHISELDVPYGTTTFACVFEVYTFYTTIYSLTDWAYGTTHTVSNGSYPMQNYNSTSYLSWNTPDFNLTWHPYANSGTPGESVWTGTASQAQQHCVDLRIVVPNSQPPGTYTATAQYTLIVN